MTEKTTKKQVSSVSTSNEVKTVEEILKEYEKEQSELPLYKRDGLPDSKRLMRQAQKEVLESYLIKDKKLVKSYKDLLRKRHRWRTEYCPCCEDEHKPTIQLLARYEKTFKSEITFLEGMVEDIEQLECDSFCIEAEDNCLKCVIVGDCRKRIIELKGMVK